MDCGYVDWVVIFVGVVVVIGVVVVFIIFVVVLGFGLVLVGEDGGISFWWLIIIVLFVVILMVVVNVFGGYVVGWMCCLVGSVIKDEVIVCDGFNGLVVWGVGMIVSVVIVVSVILGGLKIVGNVV